MTVVSMKAALDAEEMLYSSASRQQNMHFDLKSALDSEDMSVSSASYSASNDQIGQQRSCKLANQVSRQYPDKLRACRGQGCRYEEKMLLDFRRGAMTPKKQRILARRGFKMTVVSMKVALYAEEMPFSSASRQQNMHFDLKSVLDAEDMSISSASWSASNDQISQQRLDRSATIR